MTTQESFLSNVETHSMQVIRDDGVYRHIRFKRPGTRCMFFDLITWPGALCYTGDMGTYVFSRIEDMFEFFREDPSRAKPGELRINLGYWSEKLIAVDGGRRNGSATEFSEEKFTQVISDYVSEWIEVREVSEESAAALRDAVQEEIIDMLHSQDESYNYRLGSEFRHDVEGDEFYFQDLWDYSFTEYTTHFKWCCYALAWGIQKYDESKPDTKEQPE